LRVQTFCDEQTDRTKIICLSHAVKNLTIFEGFIP